MPPIRLGDAIAIRRLSIPSSTRSVQIHPMLIRDDRNIVLTAGFRTWRGLIARMCSECRKRLEKWNKAEPAISEKTDANRKC